MSLLNNSQNGIQFILVGLGNPDKKYENTRHNTGFMSLDAIAEHLNTTIDRAKFKSLTTQGTIDGKKCLLMKPLTYMNSSGEAVVEAMNFYKVPIENVIVFYDDISLDVGKIRIRKKGSDGGHNGIKSIIRLTGKDSFPRVKIGIGKKPHPEYDLADWVLSSFSVEDKKSLTETFKVCYDIAKLLVNQDFDQAMNKFNSSSSLN